MELSPYTRVISLDNDMSCLYNTVNRSLVALPQDAIRDNSVSESIGDSNIEALAKMEFFLSKDEALRKASAEIDNSHKLFISVELNRSCNLRCPYCYQGDSKSTERLAEESLGLIIRYCEQVLIRSPFTDVYLKVLGGEPTLAKDSFLQLNKLMSTFCKTHGVKYHLLVDTNGTNVDIFNNIEGYSSILFTIPLTHQTCHDSVRRYVSGHGSYLDIMNNINKLIAMIPEAKIVLRHNTDSSNIELFEDYLDDLKERCEFDPWISLNYTANLNGDNFNNGLSYSSFIAWSSKEAIESLLERDLPVLTSPITSIEECQYRSKYSLKLFSDGTVGNCAMDYAKNNRTSLREILNALETNSHCAFFRQKEIVALSSDKECRDCNSLFLCGGTKKLPCIQAIAPGDCGHKTVHNIDIDSFIRTYYFAKQKGLGGLFVVFEGNEGYR